MPLPDAPWPCYAQGMAHCHRFYVSPDLLTTGAVILPPEEAHHALRVARVRDGDAVLLFDGQGREGRGSVQRVDKRDATVWVEELRAVPQPSPALTLAQAWLHREKTIEFIVRHGTELGVAAFVFFRADHSESAPKIDAKWNRLAIEACKQCGRLWLPEFRLADSLGEALEATSGDRLIAAMDEPAVPWSQALTGGDATVCIGPEGDFSGEEIRVALAMGARPISLGPTVFRSEMAAITAATVIQYEWGALGAR